MLALAAAVPAAAGDLAASLRGTWTIDKAAAVEAAAPPFYKAATPEKQRELREEMMKSMPDMSVEFTATTAAMKSGQGAPQLAAYKVTRTEKSTLWADLVPQLKNGPAPQAEKFSFEFVDADTVKMLKEGDPSPLLLKRKK
jgi:hypothetical protein